MLPSVLFHHQRIASVTCTSGAFLPSAYVIEDVGLCAQAKQDQDEAAKQQEFDHFMGADAGMFAYGDYDEDDKEADEIYAHVDDVMDKRRKVRRHRLISAPHLRTLSYKYSRFVRTVFGRQIEHSRGESYSTGRSAFVRPVLLYCIE